MLSRLASGTIFRRLVSITMSTLISILIVYLYSRYNSDKSWVDLILSFRFHKLKIKDVIWPLIITATIFLGPIVDEILSSLCNRHVVSIWQTRPNFSLILRNWVVGPVVEEIVFRCINCTLLSNDFPTHYSIIISGILFGAAHLHPQIMQHVFLDMERQLLVDSIIQFLYTSAFGMYVASIFMKTRSLWPAAMVHIFCNIMGAPTNDIIRTRWLKFVTTAGLAGWLVLYTNYLIG